MAKKKKAKPAPRKPAAKPKPKSKEAGGNAGLSGPALDGLRKRINELDQNLVALLNERASLVVDVGRQKRAAGLPIYTPHRETEVLERALGLSDGPLPDRSLEAIFRELMSGSIALQQALRIGFLGPQGSYSHLASVRHFGSSVEYTELPEIAAVFEEVARGHVHYGLVPVENSTGGGIAETLDCFRDGKAGGKSGDKEQVSVCAEVQLAVHHALLGMGEPRRIKRIYSKPEVFQQCRKWLARQFGKAELIPSASSSRAAEIAAEECRAAIGRGETPESAAIGSAWAGQMYGLTALFERIEDQAENITRFMVLSRQLAKPTGDDKTSLMFNTTDTPGALVHVLQEFERERINLTHIEKRPSGKRNWTYTFFVDCQTHRDDPAMVRALGHAVRHCRELVVLGSYPRSRRVLSS